MRFHIGFSKRISWKWIIGILGILGALLLGNHVVLAAESGSYSYSPSSVVVHNYDNSADHNLSWSSTNSGALGGNGAYARFSSCQGPGGLDCDPVYNGYVDYSYSAHDFCSTSDKVTITTRYYTRTTNPPIIFPTNNFQTVNPVRLNSRTFDSSNNIWIISFTIPDNSSFKLRFGFENDYNTYYPFVSSSVRISMQYNCEYSLEQSTSDIINNSNNNTQQIIDSQQDINDSITNDNVQSGTSHGGNFFTNTTLPDHGLSSIVTLPINLLQGILNSQSSCNDFIFFDTNDLFGLGSQIITLPSGCILWSRAPSSVQLVYHSLLMGILGYWVLVDIWRTVNAVLDPERKNDYVMDL